MTLLQEINQLQDKISNLMHQSGIQFQSINLSLQAKESSFVVFSITWNSPTSGEPIEDSNIHIPDNFERCLINYLFDSGLTPFHCSIIIHVQKLNSINVEKWKAQLISNKYIKKHKKINGVNVDIIFVSTIANIDQVNGIN